MFKKKSKKETEVVTKEEPKYYEEDVIKLAMKVLNEALKTGQITHKYSHKGLKLTLAVLSDAYTNPYDVVYCNPGYLDSGFRIPILDQMEIKSKKSIEKEVREEKQKELEKLQECQAKDLANIERLARELGNK